MIINVKGEIFPKIGGRLSRPGGCFIDNERLVSTRVKRENKKRIRKKGVKTAASRKTTMRHYQFFSLARVPPFRYAQGGRGLSFQANLVKKIFLKSFSAYLDATSWKEERSVNRVDEEGRKIEEGVVL